MERMFAEQTSSLRKSAMALKDVALNINDDLTGDLSILDRVNRTMDGTNSALKQTYKKFQENVVQVRTMKQVFILSMIIVIVFFILYYSLRYMIVSYMTSGADVLRNSSGSSVNNNALSTV